MAATPSVNEKSTTFTPAVRLAVAFTPDHTRPEGA